MTDILVSLTEKIRPWLPHIPTSLRHAPCYYNSIFLQIDFYSSNTEVLIDLYQNSAIFLLYFLSDSFAMLDAWLCGPRSNLNKTHSIILRGKMQFLFLSLPLSRSLSLPFSILTSYVRSRLYSAQKQSVFLRLKAEFWQSIVPRILETYVNIFI